MSADTQDDLAARPRRPTPVVQLPAANAALVRAGPQALVQAIPGLSNQAFLRVAGPTLSPVDPLADPHFNPETIVNELARAIDSHDSYPRQLPVPSQVGAFGYSVPRWEVVRKIDAAKVIAALDDLTAEQAAYVARLYAQLNSGRPLEQDLFGGGGSETASDLKPEAISRIRPLLRGTKATRPTDATPPARIDADAAELRQLLAGTIDDTRRERLMTLLRRPPVETAALATAYLRTFSRVLAIDLGVRLSGRQLRRANALLAGDQAGADALAVEDKLVALDAVDRQLEQLSGMPLTMTADLRSRRDKLTGEVQAMTLSRSPEEVARLLAVATAAGPTVEQHLQATLTPSAAGAIVSRASGDAVTTAAYELIELERTKSTHTDKIAPILRRLRAAARADLEKMMFDERVPVATRERLAQDPEGQLKQTAATYLHDFTIRYDALRAGGRSWQQIVDSADRGNAVMLNELVAGGGTLTGIQELEFAISRGNADRVVAVLSGAGHDTSPQELERSYDKAHGTWSLRLKLFGPFGPDRAMALSEASPMHGARWLLYGRNAARAVEALGRPTASGGPAEVAWLAQGAKTEVAVTEATSGITGSVREWGDDPETQSLMNRSVRQLTELQARFDPWAADAPQQVARARRLRATVTGDAAAYEEENEAIRAKLRDGISFALTMAIGLAVPGLGYGFALSLALNVAGTIAVNAAVYGSQYGAERFKADLLGGLLGGLGGKLGEELVGAVAARVAQRAAPGVAGAAERAGIQTTLRAESASLQVTAREAGLLEQAARWGGDYAGSTGVQSVVSGSNEFGASSLGEEALSSVLGMFLHRRPTGATTPAAGSGEPPAGSSTPGTVADPARLPSPPHESAVTSTRPALDPAVHGPAGALPPAGQPTARIPDATGAARPATGPARAGTAAGEPTAGPSQGGMRGQVLEVAAHPVLSDADLPGIRAELIRQSIPQRVPDQRKPLRADADFGGIPFPDAQTMRIPLLDPAGRIQFADVQVDLRLGTPGPGVHGPASGHAANELTFDGRRWRAVFTLDPRLSRADAAVAVRHEANEVAGIVDRLHHEARSGALSAEALQAAIHLQQTASVTREGAISLEVTEHDISTVRDLGELFDAHLNNPSAEATAALDRQIGSMGFGSRYFGQEMTPAVGDRAARRTEMPGATREQLIREHVPERLRQPLLDYVAGWRAEAGNIPMVPFDNATRPLLSARAGEYTDALAGDAAVERRAQLAQLDAGPGGHNRPPGLAQPTPAETLDLIERLASAARGRDTLTVADLEAAGISAAQAAAVTAGMGPGTNPYRHLYAELESLFVLRRRLRADPPGSPTHAALAGAGTVRNSVAVQAMTTTGTLEGASFGDVMQRLTAAGTAGPLDAKSHPGTPPKPLISTVAEGPTGTPPAIRLTWKFGRSPGPVETFSIDLPGRSIRRAYEAEEKMHGGFEADRGTSPVHLSETGVVVPAGSSSAHIIIVKDGTFATQLRSWGVPL